MDGLDCGEEKPFRRGDANGDGIFDISDAMTILACHVLFGDLEIAINIQGLGGPHEAHTLVVNGLVSVVGESALRWASDMEIPVLPLGGRPADANPSGIVAASRLATRDQRP